MMKWDVQIGDRTRQVELRRDGKGYAVAIDGRRYRIDAARPGPYVSSLLVGSDSYDLGVTARGERYTVDVRGRRFHFDLFDPSTRWAGSGSPGAGADGPREINAVMPGRVVAVLVKEGDEVEAGQGLAILEAMKMENEVESPRAGEVTAVHVKPGQVVEAGEKIATVE
jgi:biotin carboxyl carrier protein